MRRHVLIFILYNLLLLLFSPALIVFAVWKLALSHGEWKKLPERFGFLPLGNQMAYRPLIWLHVASFGEEMAAKPIRRMLQEYLPEYGLFHSVFNPDGLREVTKSVGKDGTVVYFPFDFLPSVWYALYRVRPKLIVLVETELWPNFLAVARWFGCKIMVVNGRISERSLRGATYVAPLYRWMTDNCQLFCMQSEEDARRIIRLGADASRVCVVGNSKFDIPITAVSAEQRQVIYTALGLDSASPLLVAGSTHAGEETLILAAFRQVRTKYPSVRLVMTPRDISRAEELEKLIIAEGFTVVRRTLITPTHTPTDVIILDTIGELLSVYALATSVFVGGSLVAAGGHNILEPISMGKTAIFGPYMYNFRDISSIALQADVGIMVTSTGELAQQWLLALAQETFQDAQVIKAATLFHKYAGAAQRCAEKARALLQV